MRSSYLGAALAATLSLSTLPALAATQTELAQVEQLLAAKGALPPILQIFCVRLVPTIVRCAPSLRMRERVTCIGTKASTTVTS